MDFSYNAILPYLYVGSKEAITEYIPMDNDPFYFIVNCTVNIPFPKYPIEKQLRIPVEDDERDNVKMLEMMLYTNVLEKIYKCVCNGQRVLIYGNQRAYALATYFLIKYRGMTLKQAVYHIEKKRSTELNPKKLT